MLNVYVDEDAMKALADLGEGVVSTVKTDITVEFIDVAPLTAFVRYDGADAEISIYVRNEMHTDSRQTAHGTSKNGEVTVDEGDEGTVNIAFLVAEGVNKYMQDNGLTEEYRNVDEEGGVLFRTDKDNNLNAKVVVGKKRPALLCTTLFGAPRMTRPYSDEIMDQLFNGSMSAEELEEAANDGDADAMEQLAMAYLNGDNDVEEDPEKAYYWFVKCAETGNDQAMFNAGLFTAKGFGTERDFAKAAEWMQKAADEGDGDAQALVLEYGNLAVAEKKAKEGDAQAQADLAAGLMKIAGSLEQAGVDKDYEESVMWAEKAVAQGNADGYWTLALAYEHGRGVEEDTDKAIELYQKGADAGSAVCQLHLGCEYAKGVNIPKDTHKAFDLFKISAEHGNGFAMREMGRCYQFAVGTPGNMKTALEWYEKAVQVIHDPELEQKIMVFKMLAENEPDFGEDYPESDDGDVDFNIDDIVGAIGAKFDDEDFDDEDFDDEDDEDFDDEDDGDFDDEGTDKYMTGIIPDAISNAWKYEDELDMSGFMPEAPHGEEAWPDIPRVCKKAEEGDERAIKILSAPEWNVGEED